MQKVIFLIVISILILESNPKIVEFSTSGRTSGVQINYKKQLSSDAITILGNAELENYASNGNGTEINPFIIENYIIEGNSTDINGFTIINTTAFFILRNIQVSGPFSNGIYLFNVWNGVLENNSVSYSANGIFLQSSWYLKVINNRLTNSSIIIKNSFDCKVVENNIIFASNYGISVYYSNFVNMYNNTVKNSQSDGIYIVMSHSGQLINNTVMGGQENGASIIASNSVSLEINFFFHNSNNGISINVANNVTLMQTVIGFNKESGIDIQDSSLIMIQNNTIIKNNRGIYSITSNDTIITQNTIQENNYHGIDLASSNRFVIVNNNIIRNFYYGVYLENYQYCSCTGDKNQIYLNRFIDNNFVSQQSSQAYSETSTNLWDFNNLGNFWSDYKGSDIDNNSIGDSAYKIDGVGNEQDVSPIVSQSFIGLSTQRLTISSGELENQSNEILPLIIFVDFQSFELVASLILISFVLIMGYSTIRYNKLRNSDSGNKIRLEKTKVKSYSNERTKQSKKISETNFQKLEAMIAENEFQNKEIPDN